MQNALDLCLSVRKQISPVQPLRNVTFRINSEGEETFFCSIFHISRRNTGDLPTFNTSPEPFVKI